jgi:hypothetical protein
MRCGEPRKPDADTARSKYLSRYDAAHFRVSHFDVQYEHSRRSQPR